MSQFGMTEAHKMALRKNRVTLVQQLHVDQIFLAIFIEQGILPDSQKQKIDAISEALRSKRATWVIDFVPKKGPEAMKALIDALMTTKQSNLANLLDKELVNQWKREHPEEVDTDEETKQSDDPDNTVIKMEIDTKAGGAEGYPYEAHAQMEIITPETANINIRLTETSQEFADKIRKDIVYSYPVIHKGIAVIINIEYFSGVTPKGSHLTRRLGTDQDVKNIRRLLENLGYKVDTWPDCDNETLIAKLEKCRSSQDHGDSFVMFILSHGYNGGFYSADSKEFPLKSVVQKFSESTCPLLSGKPKMFFIQACQGNDRSYGVETMDVDESDGKMADEITKKFENLGIKDQDITRASTLNEIIGDEHNVCLAFSTVPKYVSIRHEQNGTWFIRDLVTVFASCAHEKHLQEMLTEVISRVSKRRSKRTLFKKNERGEEVQDVVEYVQISCTKDSLSKKVYFLPGFHQ